MHDISPIDRRKAMFLADYRKICEKHRMMVAMFETDGADNFVVADFTRDPGQLEQAIAEMHLEPLRVLITEEDYGKQKEVSIDSEEWAEERPEEDEDEGDEWKRGQSD